MEEAYYPSKNKPIHRKKLNKPLKQMKPTSLWQSIFFAHSGGLSSKRICGFIGWFICMIVFVLAFALQREIPEFSDMVIIVSASLMGVDSITSIFSKSVNK